MATNLNTVKFMLRIDASSAMSDETLAALVKGAEAEALQFLDLDALPDDADAITPAIALLVQCSFDTQTPDEIRVARERAEQILFPYRGKLGV